MARNWIACALLSVIVAPGTASAQQVDDHPMSAAEIALGCAPRPSLGRPAPTALRLTGSQDVIARTIFGPRDLLVVSGGASGGVSLGQRYFVRRVQSYGGLSTARYAGSQHVTQTTGWIRIVAVNDTTAIATVEHACNIITQGDYLEPFVAPVVPAGADPAEAMGDLDFSSVAHVVFGDDERTSIGVGEFALVDRGSQAGVKVGSRFAIYRDVRLPDVPLASVGDAIVVSEAPDAAVVRIVRARDAVYKGDFLVPEKK